MTVTVDFWHLVGLLLSFIGVLVATGRMLLAQLDKRLDLIHSRVGLVEKDLSDFKARMPLDYPRREDAEAWRNIERDLLKLKADMSIKYVRREDYIRGQSVIEAKLDSLAGKLENWQLRSVNKGEQG